MGKSYDLYDASGRAVGYITFDEEALSCLCFVPGETLLSDPKPLRVDGKFVLNKRPRGHQWSSLTRHFLLLADLPAGSDEALREARKNRAHA